MRDIEHAVVGLAVRNPSVIPEVLTRIKPIDIWDPKARDVLESVVNLWADGTHVDALGVAQRLKDTQTTASDVFSMIESACPPASLKHHLASITEASSLRSLSAAGQRIHQLAESGEKASTVAGKAQEMITEATHTDESATKTLGEVMPSAIDRIRAAGRGESDAGLPTGFIDLDDMLHGLAGGQMIIIGARPGYGKTTLATDLMRHASIKLGVPSLMFSLEMGEDELATRILSAEAKVPLGKLISGQLSDLEVDTILATQNRLTDAPIHIDATAGASIAEIVAKARLHVEHKGVGLIVVDYLQLLRAEGVFSREQEIASYSRAMKLLAKQTGVPVVVVAQLNRESAKRGGKPAVSDLRESGALEQDADVIMLLDRPDMVDKDHERAGEMDVIVAKNRRGETGSVKLATQLHYSRFQNLASSGA